MITSLDIISAMKKLKEQGIKPIVTDKDFWETAMFTITVPSFSRPLEKKEKPMKKGMPTKKMPKGGKKGKGC